MKNKTYRVVCKTDPYHASRNAKFNHENEWCEPEWRHMSLREANDKLFEFFKKDTFYFANWGLAVIWSKRPRGEYQDITCCTCSDGTRAYDNDVYCWRVEEEENE